MEVDDLFYDAKDYELLDQEIGKRYIWYSLHCRKYLQP